jgi:hypothetical protein
MILTEVHEAIVGGHYVSKEMVHKILCARLWWSTLHKDVKDHCHECNVCQRVGNPSRRDKMPLNP